MLLRRMILREIIKSSKDKRIVGCKQVFTIKYQANGSIHRYKARLAAKGFTQNYFFDKKKYCIVKRC